jgi:hypothetical protein
MNLSKDKSNSSGKRNLSRAGILWLASSVLLAAALFSANNQPWGYVAPPALSGANFSTGEVVAYTPWFEDGSFKGDLLALPVGTNGVVPKLAPIWRAAQQLDNQHFSTGRRIVTTDGLGDAIPFRFADLTAAQQLDVVSDDITNYIRGDRSNESAATLRIRTSSLGDIIHSTPAYVGRPAAGYVFDDYLEFAADNATRPSRVYVGANDGMLHAFDGRTGDEVFAYVPSMVIENLVELTEQPYAHYYFVDGPLTSGDVHYGDNWHSVVVGGLGAGGKGYFALDVSSALAATEGAAADKILWEFHTGSTGAVNLGYSYSRPSIVRLNNGQWAAVVANGYLSGSGVASLYLLDVQTGAVIRELAVADDDANGLSSPTMVDLDFDGKVDAAYAGDLNGNLWKFDLESESAAGWGVAYAGQPLFQTALNGTERQPITTAPEVGRHQYEGGVMVYVGTGRLLSEAEGLDKSSQANYGIWDDDWGSGIPIDTSQLLAQQLKSVTHADGAEVRVATANVPDWDVHRGWMTPMDIADATSLDLGERVIQDVLLRDNRLSYMSVNPTVGTGDNWFVQLNAFTGGAPTKTIIDVNEDFVLNVDDNVDGNGDTEVTDVAADRAVGQYQSFGLASRPVVGVLGAGSDAALINHLNAISPTQENNPGDPGLLGGHFDLDTSDTIYGFDSGDTNGHVHEWDDKHDLTTINYFNLPDGNGSPLDEITSSAHGASPTDVFMLNIANTELSPGGVLEINGTSISVTAYHDLQRRYLAGTMTAQESFPIYKRNPPSVAELAAGVTQLTSLKLSFDAFAIISGDLLPTKTSCVKDNNEGAEGEYRNGALMIQALDASNQVGGWSYDEDTDIYSTGSASVNGEQSYATAGLIWESSLFWHWDGPCYGDDGWETLYQNCIIGGDASCYDVSDDQLEKGKKKKKKKGEEDDPPVEPNPGDPPTPSSGPVDPGHSVTNTTIGGSNDTGRLFWKELIPEE